MAAERDAQQLRETAEAGNSRLRSRDVFLRIVDLASFLTGALAAVMISLGVWWQSVPALWAVYLVLLTMAFLVTFVIFIRRIDKDERLAIESHWGGLGGGLGGWRIAPSVTLFVIAAVLLWLLLHAVASVSVPDLHERYRAAINFGLSRGMRFEQQRITGGKLVLKGTAPSDAVKNALWDQIKLANSSYDDILVEIAIAAPTGSTGQQGTGAGTTGAVVNAPQESASQSGPATPDTAAAKPGDGKKGATDKKGTPTSSTPAQSQPQE